MSVCSPLDELIDKLGGPDVVAEMTGRRWRVVRQSSASNEPVLQMRDASVDATSSSSSSALDTLNVLEVRNRLLTLMMRSKHGYNSS